MINLNVNQMADSQNRVNNVLNSLPNAAILYVLGVVDAPALGETVSFVGGSDARLYKGVVTSVNLTQGTATVKYTHTVKHYHKEGGSKDDSKSWRSGEYCVPFDVEESTSDTFEFRYLEF